MHCTQLKYKQYVLSIWVMVPLVLGMTWPLDALPPGLAAITDDFQAVRYNPAALPQERAGGVALALNYGTQFPDSLSGDIFLNGDRAGYQLHIGESIQQRLGFGIPLVDWLALGGGLTLDDLQFSELDISLSLLVRPWEYLSIGAQATLESFRQPRVDFSLGLRPFTERITIGVGSNYYNQQIALPTILAQIEPADGLRIDGGFNIEDSSWHIALSVALSSARVGSEARVSNGTSFAGGGLWAHIASRNFASIIDSPPGRLVEYHIGALTDQRNFAPDSLLVSFDPRRELRETLEEIVHLCADPGVRGIVFRKESVFTTLANFEELRQAFNQCKREQKSIIFYHTSYGNINYAFAASIADKIYLHPAGSVGLRGLATIRPYLRELLDEVGIEVTAYRSHPSKSFGSIYTEREMSESERQQIARLYQDYYALLQEMVGQRESHLIMSPQETIDAGPYLSAERALANGLVDELLYEDEFERYLEENYDMSPLVPIVRGVQMPRQWPNPTTPHVALIYANGGIVNGESIRGEQIGDDSIIATIERAAEDPDIAAIVLRIDSGGGAAQASESIARALSHAAEQKPVIAWMGGIAASGGYYIAAPASTIIASPVTLTGSIGVVALLPTIVGLSEKLGIEWDGVRGSPSADFGNPVRPASESEQARLQNLIDTLYGRFVGQVANYRGQEASAIEAVAQGQIWSGTASLEQELVDQLGGYQEVREELKRQLGSSEFELIPFEHGEQGLLRDIGFLVESRLQLPLPPELEQILRGEIEALFITPWYSGAFR